VIPIGREELDEVGDVGVEDGDGGVGTTCDLVAVGQFREGLGHRDAQVESGDRGAQEGCLLLLV
jgi:hypothetical protein